MGGGIFRIPLDMKTKLLGILSVSGGMLISLHAFGEDIMGYSKEKLQESVQETAYKFWEHCPKGDHDKGKIGGLEFPKPEGVAPEKKPDATNKWEGISWSQLKTDDERTEFVRYANDNKRPDMLTGIGMMVLIKYSPKPSGKKDIPPPKKEPKPINTESMAVQDILQQVAQNRAGECDEHTKALNELDDKVKKLPAGTLDEATQKNLEDAIDNLNQKWEEDGGNYEFTCHKKDLEGWQKCLEVAIEKLKSKKEEELIQLLEARKQWVTDEIEKENYDTSSSSDSSW
ncbi:MAG: hypothetical protein K2L24_03540 [Opitutales bacterium]|nr:hypothetical protein [Opitutales bacterium]